VGNFGTAIRKLNELGVTDALKEYIQANRPFMGICVGMQCLFEGSTEAPEPGLGIISGMVKKFDSATKSVPHIGWNQAKFIDEKSKYVDDNSRYYFVHSFGAIIAGENELNDWAHTLTTYGDETFVSSVSRG
jgi:glutamine amidotransferase/cyclase